MLDIFKKQNENYIKYKKYLGRGIALISVGSVLVLFSIPIFFTGRDYFDRDSDTLEYSNTPDILTNLPNSTKSIIFTGIGGGLFCIGATLDLISIAPFRKSVKFYKKYDEDYKKSFSMNFLLDGFKEPSVDILFIYKF